MILQGFGAFSLYSPRIDRMQNSVSTFSEGGVGGLELAATKVFPRASGAHPIPGRRRLRPTLRHIPAICCPKQKKEKPSMKFLFALLGGRDFRVRMRGAKSGNYSCSLSEM